MRRFAFTSNENDRLLLSTPTVTAANQGLYVLSTMFDCSKWSMGFRFRLASVSGTQYLFQNTISTKTKNKNWEIYMVDDDLYYNTPATGAVTMFSSLSAGRDYYCWIDAYDEDVYCYLYDTVTEVESSDTFSKTYNLAAYSLVSVLSDYEKTYPATGATIWDWAYLPGTGEYWDLYQHGGISKYFFYAYWPMREGTGTTCRNMTYPAAQLSTGGVFSAGVSWTGDDDDDSKRWQ